jgi:hypothetical protein
MDQCDKRHARLRLALYLSKRFDFSRCLIAEKVMCQHFRHISPFDSVSRDRVEQNERDIGLADHAVDEFRFR